MNPLNQVRNGALRFSPWGNVARSSRYDVYLPCVLTFSAFLGLLLLTLVGGTNSTEAAFKDPGFGARPAGMGGAFVALADDTNATLLNPAGMMLLDRPQGSFMYAKPFAGLSEVNLNLNYFSAVVPVNRVGAVGVSWANFLAPVSREDSVGVSLATSLNHWVSIPQASIHLGTTMKYLTHQFDLDERTRTDPVFAKGRSRGAMGVDVGVLVKPSPEGLGRLSEGQLSLGLVAKTLNEPDVGLLTEDRVPRELVGGAAYTLGMWTAVFDYAHRDDVTTLKGGVEAWLLNRMVGLRAGANSTAGTFGFTYNHKISATFGLSLDYGFSFPFFLKETFGSHRVAVGVRF